MRSNGLKYSAALAAALALTPLNAFAQSTDAPAASDPAGSIVLAQQTYIDVMANLEASGYTIVETKSTFLGRVQIMARNTEHLREIVVSRATGEVKRDVVVEIFATADGGADVSAPSTSAAAAEPGTSSGFGGILGALGFKPNANISAGADASASGGSGSGSSGLGGSLSGGVSGGLSGGVSGGLSGGVSGGLSGGLGGRD